MTRLFNTALAGCAALALTLSSIGAIVAVPPPQAAAPAAIATVELA